MVVRSSRRLITQCVKPTSYPCLRKENVAYRILPVISLPSHFDNLHAIVTDNMDAIADQCNNQQPIGNVGKSFRGDDIAVIGFSFKLPQGVEDVEDFWDVLQNRRNLMTPWPESRLNAESFVSGKKSKVRRSHAKFGNTDMSCCRVELVDFIILTYVCSSTAMEGILSATTQRLSMLRSSRYLRRKRLVGFYSMIIRP